MLKWPHSITAIRHVESAYNEIDKNEIKGYKAFSDQFDEEYEALNLEVISNKKFPSSSLLEKAKKLIPELAAQHSDYDTEIANGAQEQATITGRKLPNRIPLPNVVYVSPYKRTRLTLEGLQEGWPALAKVKVLEDDRIREQEYGKQTIYTDWRLYFVFNPEQALLRKCSTEYEYKHEQGESILNVRDRMRYFLSMLIREHGGEKKEAEHVMLITHHLAIMAMRANIERWSREVFLEKNKT